MSAKQTGTRRGWPLPLVLGVSVLMQLACSGNGDKDGKVQDDESTHRRAEEIVPQGYPQGQWVPASPPPPNWVWVPKGQETGGYSSSQYRSANEAQQYVDEPQQYAPAPPSGNPWAVPRYESAPVNKQWGQVLPGNRWSSPNSPPHFRPLEESPAGPPQVAPSRPLRNGQSGSAWQATAPYDRPYGSSANPGYPAPAQPYGSYPAYGGGYGAMPGYGGGYPMGGVPGMGWAGGRY